MESIYLILIIAGVTLQQIMKKAYNNRVQGGVFSFAAGSSLVALLVFAITSKGNLTFTWEYVGYSIAFATAFSTSTIFSFLAIVEGPLALTSLMIQYSLLIPTAYGLIRGEKIGVFLIVGIVLLMLSLLLINIEKKGEKKKITFRWAMYAFLAFVGNGGCSLVQKIQQDQCDKQFKSEFMLLAYGLAVIVLLVCALAFERKAIWQHVKRGCGFWAANGVFNGMVNYLVLVLTATGMAASVMFPLISAGGIIATFFVSLFVYKEKLSVAQLVGLALGIVSVVFLNL